MENASRALIIIGAVFIAIMIISIGIYLKGRLQRSADGYVSSLDTIELQKYNSIFTVYADTEKIITAQDIVTMIGAAQRYDYGTKIIIQGEGDCSEFTDQQKHEFLQEYILKEDSSGNVENSFLYIENSLKYDDYGRVKQIQFKKK